MRSCLPFAVGKQNKDSSCSLLGNILSELILKLWEFLTAYFFLLELILLRLWISGVLLSFKVFSSSELIKSGSAKDPILFLLSSKQKWECKSALKVKFKNSYLENSGYNQKSNPQLNCYCILNLPWLHFQLGCFYHWLTLME